MTPKMLQRFDVSAWDDDIKGAIERVSLVCGYENTVPTFEDVSHIVERIMRDTDWPREIVADQVMRRVNEIRDADDRRKRPDRKHVSRSQGHLQELLDEALDDTFPASDPVELTAVND